MISDRLADHLPTLVVLLQVAELADAPRIASSVTVLALSGLLRPSKSMIAFATHSFGVEDLVGVWAIRYRLSAYLGRLGLRDAVRRLRQLLCLADVIVAPILADILVVFIFTKLLLYVCLT